MLEKIKFHIIIPLEYSYYDFDKIFENNTEILKEFNSCFEYRPLKNTEQLKDSPILNEIKKFQLQQKQRKAIGISHKENCIYNVKGIPFQVGKIELYFTKVNIAFLSVDITAENLNDRDALSLNYYLTNYVKLKMSFTYERKLGKEKTETVKLTVNDLINSFLSLQTDIKLKRYSEDNKNIYTLFYGISEQFYGISEQIENYEVFLEMLRRKNAGNRMISDTIKPDNKYSPYTYIDWITGDNILAVTGNLEDAGNGLAEEQKLVNQKFLREGLPDTFSRNYLLMYLYFITVYLLIQKINESNKEDDVEKLKKISDIKCLSNQVHINDLFEKYLFKNQWKMRESYNKYRNLNFYDISKNPDVYEGDENYIFISYRHESFNESEVLDCITKLKEKNVRIWYDYGIEKDENWIEVIESHAERCHMFLAFLSKEYFDSQNTKTELSYLFTQNKKGTLIDLEKLDSELPDGFRLYGHGYDRVHKYDQKEKDFYDEIFNIDGVKECIGSEGF